VPELLPIHLDDFSPVVVFLNFSTNFDDLARKLAHIADLFSCYEKKQPQKMDKVGNLAKIEIMHSVARCFNANHLARQALRFALR
jgi:hypothetical protein